jgi:hypothetical protein
MDTKTDIIVDVAKMKVVLKFILQNMKNEAKCKGELEFAYEIKGWIDYLEEDHQDRGRHDG